MGVVQPVLGQVLPVVGGQVQPHPHQLLAGELGELPVQSADVRVELHVCKQELSSRRKSSERLTDVEEDDFVELREYLVVERGNVEEVVQVLPEHDDDDDDDDGDDDDDDDDNDDDDDYDENYDDDDDDDEFLVPCMIHGAAQAFSEPTNSSCPWLVRIESRSM